jgi:hypothetical protein
MDTKCVISLNDVAVEISKLCPGKYVSVVYNNDWYIKHMCHCTK